MTTVLVGTDSVHTTAAACDYLGPRLDTGDTVLICAVPEGPVSERDAGDAGNVARTRLVEPTVEIIEQNGDGTSVSAVLRDAAEEYDVDEIVVGANRGDPETAGDPPGSTVRELLAAADRPVVVVRV
ncbi:universal stress protein [Halovenus sp. WSH3]|uniref:Universal stress protein n=1 Tax=Halovenus carboxidivorans TaxID=2692199 RepID=A0A6B0T6F8_9EURY|nr:universal stress protein [Halovenus carboxidivorans]MXR51776.1 universal stress protein [Halovenus carboxidivorans]